MKIGIGYRAELSDWLYSKAVQIDCLELTAEHFYGRDRQFGPVIDQLGGYSQIQPLGGQLSSYVHGLGLSLGTPGPLDQQRLSQFAKVSERVNAEWVSEHVAFTRTPESDLGHLNPVPPTRESVRIMADHAREVAERCRKPLLLENITSHMRLEGELSETQFLNLLCDQADCGMLLDVTNLFVNSRNHGFDPVTWLHGIDPTRIRQLHIVGYSRRNGRYMDDHSQPVQPELLDLATEIIDYAAVEAIILERDADFPRPSEMASEIAKLEGLRAAA